MLFYPRTEPLTNMKPYPTFDHPLTISMWDYSWLTCSHPGGSFQDLRRCVREAAERGYNTLRVDVFPHFYVEGDHHFPEQGLSRRIRTWGDVLQPEGYTVNVRQKVIELADLCREYDIRLGLDTWQSFTVLGRQHRFTPEEEEGIARGWSDAWVRALKLMREDGVLERAVWVAPLNEVPIFLGNLVQRIVGDNCPQTEVGDGEIHYLNEHHDGIFMELNTWLGEAVKAEIQTDGIPLLYSGVWVENYPARVPAFYDAVDCHFMPDARLTEKDRTALKTAGPNAADFALHTQQNDWDFALFGAAWNRATLRNYGRMMAYTRDFCEMTFDTVKDTGWEVICTEAYGPCNHPDHPEIDWDVYKDYNADAARIFAGYPFSGLTLSNHAEPLFSLWQDRDWQWRGNQYLLNS